MIYFGSALLSEKQKQLPPIYRENLGIITGLEKCTYWLHGCPHFIIKTNQKALHPTYNSKPLDEISDEISDIVVLMYHYNFHGEDNEITDYLRRNPQWTEESRYYPLITDHFGKRTTVEAHISVTQTLHKYKDRIMFKIQ